MKIRVYYEDTDCGNVVYYANYLRYMERSRTELLRDRGLDLCELQTRGYMFAVIEANVKYRASARYNDLLDVDSTIREHTSATVTFTTIIRNALGQTLVTGDVRLTCINAAGRACKIPGEVLRAIVGPDTPELSGP